MQLNFSFKLKLNMTLKCMINFHFTFLKTFLIKYNYRVEIFYDT